MDEQDIVESQKPYLIRAMYEWMMDVGYTQRLIISPFVKGVVLPKNLITEELVTLDISPYASENLELGKYDVIFDAQFSGEPFHVILPLNCIGAIIAKEREVGYVFDIDEYLQVSADYASPNDEQIPTTDFQPEETKNSGDNVVQRTRLLSKKSGVLSKRPNNKSNKKKINSRFKSLFNA